MLRKPERFRQAKAASEDVDDSRPEETRPKVAGNPKSWDGFPLGPPSFTASSDETDEPDASDLTDSREPEFVLLEKRIKAAKTEGGHLNELELRELGNRLKEARDNVGKSISHWVSRMNSARLYLAVSTKSLTWKPKSLEEPNRHWSIFFTEDAKNTVWEGSNLDVCRRILKILPELEEHLLLSIIGEIRQLESDLKTANAIDRDKKEDND